MPDFSLTWVHLNMGVSLEKGDFELGKSNLFFRLQVSVTVVTG